MFFISISVSFFFASVGIAKAWHGAWPSTLFSVKEEVRESEPVGSYSTFTSVRILHGCAVHSLVGHERSHPRGRVVLCVVKMRVRLC